MYILLIGILVVFGLSSCGEEFPPASQVDGLRLLAIQASAPELVPLPRDEDGNPRTIGSQDPPAAASIVSLVADPAQLDDPSRTVSVIHLGCTPAPGNTAPGLCTALELLTTPERLGQLLAFGVCPDGSSQPLGSDGAHSAQALAGDASAGSNAPGDASGADGAGEEPGETIRLLGFEECRHESGCAGANVEIAGVPTTLPLPVYEIPDTFRLDLLPAGHPQRTNGVQAVVLSVVVAAQPQELIDGADPSDLCSLAAGVGANLSRLLERRDHVTTLKRLQIRGPDVEDDLNINPDLPNLLANGKALLPIGTEVAPGQKMGLQPTLSVGEQGVPQRFTRYDADGRRLQTETEAWLWSWYTTGGEFEKLRTRSHEVPAIWTAPGGKAKFPVPSHRRVFVYGVVRDTRGGIGWIVRELQVAP